jgi:hypothetical protein
LEGRKRKNASEIVIVPRQFFLREVTDSLVFVYEKKKGEPFDVVKQGFMIQEKLGEK